MDFKSVGDSIKFPTLEDKKLDDLKGTAAVN